MYNIIVYILLLARFAGYAGAYPAYPVATPLLIKSSHTKLSGQHEMEFILVCLTKD